MAETNPSAAGRPRKKRPPPRPITVEKVERVTPLLTRVVFGGEALQGFGPPRPGAHIKLLFVPEGAEWSPEDSEAPRPPSRTYTPRRFDPDRRQLEVEFVHHGDGIASNWASNASVGEQMYVGGPGGGYDVPEDATEIVLIADDTAMPAAGTILESLPDGCRPHVFCEITNADEQRPLSSSVSIEPNWLCRADENARQGVMLERAIRSMDPLPNNAYWWIACEAATMRRIRDYLVNDCGVDAERLHTRGYWKLGETNYPDHDYGND